MRSTSPQTSDSNEASSASKMPTTFQVCAAELDLAAQRRGPRSGRRASRPTLISRVPGVEAAALHEAEVLADVERPRADAAHRHVGRLVVGRPRQRDDDDELRRGQRLPVARRGRSAGRSRSAPAAACATALTFSDVAPLRMMMAFCGEPLATSVARKPCAIDSVMTKTATTMAMPIAVMPPCPCARPSSAGCSWRSRPMRYATRRSASTIFSREAMIAGTTPATMPMTALMPTPIGGVGRADAEDRHEAAGDAERLAVDDEPRQAGAEQRRRAIDISSPSPAMKKKIDPRRETRASASRRSRSCARAPTSPSCSRPRTAS